MERTVFETAVVGAYLLNSVDYWFSLTSELLRFCPTFYSPNHVELDKLFKMTKVTIAGDQSNAVI